MPPVTSAAASVAAPPPLPKVFWKVSGATVPAGYWLYGIAWAADNSGPAQGAKLWRARTGAPMGRIQPPQQLTGEKFEGPLAPVNTNARVFILPNGQETADPKLALNLLKLATTFKWNPLRVDLSKEGPESLGRRIAVTGERGIEQRMEAHLQAIEKTGIGVYYGDHSAYKPMSAAERQKWLDEHKKGEFKPPRESSCIGWAMENVGAALTACGQVATWNAVRRATIQNGSRGNIMASELQKYGWKGIYWNPDAKNPNDGNPEHSFSAVQVGKGKPYYGVTIHYKVWNYRPTPDKGTVEDRTTLAKLQKVPFFFGLARGGTHTFVGRWGRVNEFHWSEMPDSTHAIEEVPLEDWEWNSGAIVIPPGTWPA